MSEEELESYKQEILEICKVEWGGRLSIIDRLDLGRDPFQFVNQIDHIESDIILYDYLQYAVNSHGQQKSADIRKLLMNWREYSQRRGLAMVFAAQLNRNSLSHTRDDPTPNQGDLEGSGGIEQEAANVLFLHNLQALFPGRPKRKGDFKVVLGKTRFSGGIGSSIPFDFNGELVRFNE